MQPSRVVRLPVPVPDQEGVCRRALTIRQMLRGVVVVCSSLARSPGAPAPCRASTGGIEGRGQGGRDRVRVRRRRLGDTAGTRNGEHEQVEQHDEGE